MGFKIIHICKFTIIYIYIEIDIDIDIHIHIDIDRYVLN